MGHHFVLHILIVQRDASAWLIWVPTPAGSRRGRMWAQASHIELRWHNVNITECFTRHHVTSPPWSCSPGHHCTPPRLADTSCWLIFWRLVTRTCEEKVETLQSLWQDPHPGCRANIWCHISHSQNLDSGEAPQHCPHYNIIKLTLYYIMMIKKIIYL